VKIYFVRHGESTGNKAGTHQIAETPLSGAGRRQVKRVAQRLKKFKIDLICSSSHTRTRQTAEIISKTIGTPIEYWDDLTELRNPSQIGGKPVNSTEALRIRKLIKENFTKENWKYSDEETFSELKNRVENVISHLLQKHAAKNIVCVSHATMIKAIIAKMIFGKDLTAKIFLDIRYHLWSTNTGVTVCEYSKDNGWAVINWNDSSHL
jgi:broad specificity phosphatase PhoE